MAWREYVLTHWPLYLSDIKGRTCSLCDKPAEFFSIPKDTSTVSYWCSHKCKQEKAK